MAANGGGVTMFHKGRFLAAIILFLIAIFALPFYQHAQAAEIQVAAFDSLDVNIDILANSDMEITETQKYSFLEGTFHYGLRWIPLDEVDSIDKIQVYEEGRTYVRNPAVRRWIDNYKQSGESPAGDYYAYYTWIEDNKLWIGWWYPETRGGEPRLRNQLCRSRWTVAARGRRPAVLDSCFRWPGCSYRQGNGNHTLSGDNIRPASNL